MIFKVYCVLPRLKGCRTRTVRSYVVEAKSGVAALRKLGPDDGVPFSVALMDMSKPQLASSYEVPNVQGDALERKSVLAGLG